jgi:hypothetical protein
MLQGRPEVHKNKYVTNAASYKLPQVLAAASKGIQCFDCPFYAAENEDIPRSFNCLALFDHYINHGQFEGRAFKCVGFFFCYYYYYSQLSISKFM